MGACRRPRPHRPVRGRQDLGDALSTIGVLLVGAVGAGVTAFGGAALWLAFLHWYLPRYGITVDAERISNTYAYTDTNGVTRPVYSKPKGPTVRVAYNSRKSNYVAVCESGPVRPGTPSSHWASSASASSG
ncbi:hypothetical protein [Streptomyces sp. NPDC000410]|uniref:hypothetical protein n=1 Tax=Streptomyces sp. NPDC000410 TaxID=3154254 RepID=UPI0033328F6D